MPSQSFTHTSHADAAVATVWESLNLPATWEAIGGVDRVYDPIVDDNGDLRGFSFESVVGGLRYVGTARPRERKEGSLMSWDIVNRELRGVTRVELSPVDQGTSITVTIEMESVGIVSRMFFGVIATAVGSGLPKAVEGFASGLSRPA